MKIASVRFASIARNNRNLNSSAVGILRTGVMRAFMTTEAAPIPPPDQQKSPKKSVKAQLKAMIMTGRIQGRPDVILNAVRISKKDNISLDMKEYMSILWACTEVKNAGADEAFWIYDLLKKDQAIPLDVYQKVLQVCANRNNIQMATKVFEDYKNLQTPMSETMFTEMLALLIRNCLYVQKKELDWRAEAPTPKALSRSSGGSSSDSPLQDMTNLLNEYYESYRKLKVEKQWRTGESIYIDMLKYHNKLGHTDDVLQVLRHMTEDEHEPPLHLCDVLMEGSLVRGDHVVLRVLSSWYLNNFNTKLEMGLLTRLMQIASSQGDAALAMIGLRLFAKNGHKLGRFEYSAVIFSCLRSDDIMGALETLVEAASQGIDFMTPVSAGDAPSQGLQIVGELSGCLAVSLKRLDDFYFSLVDLIRGKYHVPPLALNALIIAAGRMNNLDRSFAAFEEYESLFQLKPDVHSYNALLAASAYTHFSPSLSKILPVLQDMEKHGIAPDSTSFSILLEFMSQIKDFTILEEVLDHMHSLNIQPSARSLRRISIALTKQNHPLSQRTRAVLPSHEALFFFRKRITRITNANEKAQRVIQDEQNKANSVVDSSADSAIGEKQ